MDSEQNKTDTSVKHQRLNVGICTVWDFFYKTKLNIKIPDYQRSYVWDEEKLEELLLDLDLHFFKSKEGSSETIEQKEVPMYYMGTVLLHRNNNNYEIIDGQQRITTLLLLDYIWHKENSILGKKLWQLQYSSLLSKNTIKRNYQHLNKIKSNYRVANISKNLYSRLAFSVIITYSQDQAFTFFDSQNNRGVQLSAVDFLKSYHLREIKEEKTQQTFAKKWDSNNKDQALASLFEIILWRTRNWKGKALEWENKKNILKNFQKDTIRGQTNIVHLYPNSSNILSQTLIYQDSSGICLNPAPLFLQTQPHNYPFAIRQPLQKGIAFFLFVEKYKAIYDLLFIKKEHHYLDKLYETIYCNVSYYLKQFFKLSIIMFYDKFKEYKLYEFAHWLDYLLGSYRIRQKSIVAQTTIKILRDNHQNLLDVIEMAYRPEDIITFLIDITYEDAYKIEIEKLGSENGVRNFYRKNNLEYFFDYETRDEEISLSDKKIWIYAQIAKQKEGNK